MEERFERYHPNMEAITGGFRTGPCLVCMMVQGKDRFPDNIVYEDDRALVFLDEDLEHGPRGGVRSNAHRRTHYVL